MTVLLMGFRLGAAKALERQKVPYIIWAEKPLLKSRSCEGIIIKEFPSGEAEIEMFSSLLDKVTHVVASSESAVIPASKIRRWLNLFRNKKSVIIRCTDKLEMKRYLSSKDIPMAKFMSSTGKTAADVINNLGLPVVNKVRLSSGGRGVQFLRTEEEVEQSLNRKSYFEKVIKGTEGSIESFIVDGEVVFSNITEYYKNGICNILPGQYSDDICKKIHSLNLDVIKALNLKWGMTHLEYYILENEQIVFGEVALRPPGGYIMEALELAYGQSFWDLFIAVELKKKDITFNCLSKYASSIIVHPGEGVVTSILGEKEVTDLESVTKFKLKLKVGDLVAPREGVGQDYGYLLLANSDRNKLSDDVRAFFSVFSVVVGNL